MVTSIDEPRPDAAPPMEAHAEIERLTEAPRAGSSDPYADMELQLRHERTERLIRKARELD